MTGGIGQMLYNRERPAGPVVEGPNLGDDGFSVCIVVL